MNNNKYKYSTIFKNNINIKYENNKLNNNNNNNNNINNNKNNNNNNNNNNKNNNNNNNKNNNKDEENITYKSFVQNYNSRSSAPDIISVATNLGLTITIKRELLERIQNYLLAIQNLEKEVYEKENVNSFNKEKPKLVITENLETVEKSFWKVFRSKPLFKLIFSNFKYSDIKSYDDLIGVKSILNKFSNGIEIIKDKVKSSNIDFIKNNGEVTKILSVIFEDTTENREFYNKLFTIYSPYNKKNQFNNTGYWLLKIVLSTNIFATSQYITQFGIETKSIIEYISTHNTMGSSYKDIKLFKYLKSNQYVDNSRCNKFELLLDFLYDKSFTFKQLIKSFKIIFSNYDNYSYNNSNHRKNNKYNYIIKELSKLELNQFTDNQLNSTILEIIRQPSGIATKHNNKNIKTIIYKYYKIFHSISKFSSGLNKDGLADKYPIQILKYYLLFKDNAIEKVRNQMKRILLTNRSQSLSAIFKVIYQYLNAKLIESLYNEIGKFIFGKDDTTSLILSTNDLKIIQPLLELALQDHLHIYIEDLVKSISCKEVLEYFYNHHKFGHELKSADLRTWENIKSMEIFEHYESLMVKSGNPIKVGVSAYNYIENPILGQFVYRIYNQAPSAYQIKYSTNEIDYSYFFLTLNHYIQIDKPELIFQIIPPTQQTISVKVWDLDYNKFYKSLKWILQYTSKQSIIKCYNSSYRYDFKYSIILSKDLNTGKISGELYEQSRIEKYKTQIKNQKSSKEFIFTFDIGSIFKLLLRCGMQEDVFELFSLQPELLKAYSSDINNSYIYNSEYPVQVYKSLSKLCIENLDNKELKNKVFINILYGAANRGSISFFKSLFYNYEFIFRKKSDGKYVIERDQLQKIIEIAKTNQNNQLLDFLLVCASLN